MADRYAAMMREWQDLIAAHLERQAGGGRRKPLANGGVDTMVQYPNPAHGLIIHPPRRQEALA